eukprot:14457044-Heterocapsa_arctica.AAC.1
MPSLGNETSQPGWHWYAGQREQREKETRKGGQRRGIKCRGHRPTKAPRPTGQTKAPPTKKPQPQKGRRGE